MAKKRKAAGKEKGGRSVMKGRAKYASIFEHSAVALWEEDISRLRSKLLEMKTGGGFSLRAHLAAHPEFVQEAVGLIDVIDVNQAALRLFGADRKEQLLGPLAGIRDSAFLAAFAETILAIDEGTTDVESESTTRTLKGRKLSVIVKTHIPASDAAFPHMLVSLVDITERRKIEDELRTAKEFAENLIHTANVMVLGLDLDGRVTIFNRVAEETTGYPRAEIMHRSWFETVVPKDRYPEVWREFEKLTYEGSTGTFDNPILTKSGEERHIVWQNSQIRESGRVTGTLSFGIDITNRRRMERDLAWERTLFSMLMEHLPDRIYFKDKESRFIRISRADALALGLDDPSQAIGKTDADFFSAEHALMAFEDEQRIIRTGEPLVDIEEKETYPDRPDTWVITTKMPFRDSSGTIVGTFGISHDITERKQAEYELRKAKEFAENLIHTADVMVLGLDLEGRVTIFNRVAEETTGYPRTELMNRSWFETVVPKDRYPDVRREFERLARGGNAGTFENPILTKSGEERYIVWQNSQIREGDRVTGILSFGIDITSRRQMEKDLDWERTLFNMLMEHLPDHIYFKDTASRFIRTSWSHARDLGLRDPCEAVGKTDADFYGADHALKAFEDEQRVMKTGTPLVGIEEKETYPDRPDTWVITTKGPFRDSSGTIVGTFGISHDVTARKRLEEKNQQLAALVESADDAIIGQDLDRRITVWNQGAEHLYGYCAEEMIGAPMSPLVPPELEGQARLIMERLARGERITNFESTALRKDGSRVMVSFAFGPIRDTQDRIVGIASVARDVTAQKELQAQVNRAQRLEGLAALAGGIAHQFNNINTIVRGYLTLLQSEKNLTARLASYVEAACAGVQKAVDITDRLLFLTEPGDVSGTLRLDVLARTQVHLHAKRIEEENVRLVLDLAETPPVRGDDVRMRYVLSSLVNNALDSLLDRPVRMVSVRTGSTKEAAWLEVGDSGCGITDGDLPRIFSPFFSLKGEWAAPGSLQARLKGMGLSLAISNATVSGYGGRIEVQSTEGVGSTFRVVMPLATR
jgi:PAS domain S-box-containing protein